MALIEWKEDFNVGIESVDHEHRQMINLINRLHESLAADAPKAEVAAFLGSVHSLISAHFALEEIEMRNFGYDDLATHKDDHEELLARIRDIMDQVEADSTGSYAKDLGTRLQDWFSVHFRNVDARMHRFVKARDNQGG